MEILELLEVVEIRLRHRRIWKNILFSLGGIWVFLLIITLIAKFLVPWSLFRAWGLSDFTRIMASVLPPVAVAWVFLSMIAPNAFFFSSVYSKLKRMRRLKEYELAIPLAEELLKMSSPWHEMTQRLYLSFFEVDNDIMVSVLFDYWKNVSPSDSCVVLGKSDKETQSRCLDFLVGLVSPKNVITEKHWTFLKSCLKDWNPVVVEDFLRKYAPMAAGFEGLFSVFHGICSMNSFREKDVDMDPQRRRLLELYFSHEMLTRLNSPWHSESESQAVELLKSGAVQTENILQDLFQFSVTQEQITEETWIYLITFVQKVYGCHNSFGERDLRLKFQKKTRLPKKSEIKACYEVLGIPVGCTLDVARRVCYEMLVRLGEELETKRITQKEYDEKSSSYRAAADKIAVWGYDFYWRFEYWEALVCKICSMNLDVRDLQIQMLREEGRNSVIEKFDRVWYEGEVTWALRELGKKYDNEKKPLVELLFRLAVTEDGIREDEWQFLQDVMTSSRLNYNFKRTLLKKYEPLRVSGYSSSSEANRKKDPVVRLDECYAILQVPLNAPLEEVRKSYYALAKIHHPDMPHNAGCKCECEAMMAKLNEAYEKICG